MGNEGFKGTEERKLWKSMVVMVAQHCDYMLSHRAGHTKLRKGEIIHFYIMR